MYTRKITFTLLILAMVLGAGLFYQKHDAAVTEEKSHLVEYDDLSRAEHLFFENKVGDYMFNREAHAWVAESDQKVIIQKDRIKTAIDIFSGLRLVTVVGNEGDYGFNGDNAIRYAFYGKDESDVVLDVLIGNSSDESDSFYLKDNLRDVIWVAVGDREALDIPLGKVFN